jgi:hypothetical protein
VAALSGRAADAANAGTVSPAATAQMTVVRDQRDFAGDCPGDFWACRGE